MTKNKTSQALTNATAIDREMKRIEGQLAYATPAVRAQMVARLRKLRAARTVSLNAA